MPKNEGGGAVGKNQYGKYDTPTKTGGVSPTYQDLNITYKDASRCQQMAKDKKEIAISVLTALTISINALIEGKEKGVFGIDVFKIFCCLGEGFIGTFLVVVFTVGFLKSVLSKELNSIKSDNANFPYLNLVMICSPLLIYNLLNIFVSIAY